MNSVITSVYDQNFSPNFSFSSFWFSSYMLNILDHCLLISETFNTPKYELLYSPRPLSPDVSASVNGTKTVFLAMVQWDTSSIKPRHWILKVYDFHEISAKYCACIIFILLLLKKYFRNCITVSKRSDIQKKKKRKLKNHCCTAAFSTCFSILYVYDNAIRKSQIHIFRLPLQSFWSHFLTITYQHKLSVVGLILLKEQKRSRIFCPEKEV